MLYRKKRSKKYKKIRRIIISLLIIVSLIIYFFEAVADPYQRNLIESRAKVIAEESITDGVTQILESQGYTYEDFVKIVYSSANEVQSITINSVNVNKFKTDVNHAIEVQLAKNHNIEFFVPLGAFTGITVLSDDGPNIRINFRLAGSFNSKINSTFESAGINQTLHHLELLVEANVISTSPGYTKQIIFETNFEIAQTVIVGGIPNLYTGLKGLGLS